MNDVSDRDRRTFEAFRRYILPLAAVAETISTRGASPGTTAFAAERNFLEQEERQKEDERKKAEIQAKAMQRAIENKYRGIQMELAKEQIASMKGKTEREAKKAATEEELSGKFRESLGGNEDISDVDRAAFGAAGPKTYLETMAKRNKPDPMELLKAKLAGQESLLSKKLAGQEALYGKKFAGQKELARLKSSLKQATSGGKGKSVLQGSAFKLAETEQGISQLDRLVEDSESFKSLSNSPLDIVRALNPWDEDAKSFNQLIKATKQAIGKGLEGGVLRKEDEKKYDYILPKLGEPINIRMKKAQQLREMLVSKYNTDLSSLGKAGVDISGYYPIEPKIYGETQPEGQAGSSASSYLEEIRARRAYRGQE